MKLLEHLDIRAYYLDMNELINIASVMPPNGCGTWRRWQRGSKHVLLLMTSKHADNESTGVSIP